MKALTLFVLFGLAILGNASPCAAQNITEVDSVAALAGMSGITASSVYLASYYCKTGLGTPCQPDGGEGILLKSSAANCASGGSVTPDGGSVFADMSGYCWYRENLNGDLRQWGITNGSGYDASIHSTTTTPAVVKADTPISQAITALAKIGITTLNTAQVSIYLQKAVNIPASGSLTCGATGGGQYAGGVYAGLNSSGAPLNTKPGTVFLEHGAYLQFANSIDHNTNHDSTSINNCIIVPEWLQTGDASACVDGKGNSGLAFTYPAASYDDLEAIRANMIICGDHALFFNGASGAWSHDLWIYGFDNPIHILKGDHFILTNALIDGDICVYSEQGGGLTKLNEVTCDPILTRQVLTNNGQGIPSGNNNCLQTNPATHGFICNSEYWQITHISNSPTLNAYGRPVCRLILEPGQKSGKWDAAPPISLLTTSSIQNGLGDPITYPMWISNLDASTGGLGCIGRGPHAIANIIGLGPTLQLDLLNSDYGTGLYPIAATAMWDPCATPPCVIRIVTGNVDALAAGETLGDPTGHLFPPNTSILDVVREAKGPDPFDGYIAEISVNAALPGMHNTGSDTSITIDTSPQGIHLAATGGTDSCDDGNNGQCAVVSAAERVIAFQPPAPTPPVSAAATQAVANLPESNAHYYGAGFVDNGTAALCAIDAFSYAHHYGFAVQDANNTCLVNKDGDDNGDVSDRGDTFFVVSGSSNQLSVQGNGSGKSGTALVNDLYALTIHNGSGTTSSAINMTIAGITVTFTGATTSFPSDQGSGHIGGKGTARLCTTPCNANAIKEFVTYEITSANQVVLLARGRFFTAPGSFPAGSAFDVYSVSRPTGCNSFSSTGAPVVDRALNAVEQIGGCLQLVNFKDPEAKNIFVGHNATIMQLTSTALPQTTFYYEDATALASMTGCGNVLLPPSLWNCSQPLAHGQVYLSYSTGTTSLQLCPKNGSGLLIDGQLQSVPLGCLGLKNASAPLGFDYVYATNDTRGISSVVGVPTPMPTTIEVTTVDSTPFLPGDQVQVSCSGAQGHTGFDSLVLSGLATMQTPSSFDFAPGSFTAMGAAYQYGGTCTILGLVASATGHSIAANGVEVQTGDTSKTLVGAVNVVSVSGTPTIYDAANKRNVASWFNRQNKNCFAQIASTTGSLSNTGYSEVDPVNLHCDFVGLGQSNTSWSTAGSATSTGATGFVSTAAGFDSATSAENEFTEGTSGGTGNRLSISVSGNRMLPEGPHYATMLYKVNGTAAHYQGGSSIEVRLLQ